MGISISPTQSNLQAALKSFLQAVLPSGTPIVAGEQNRVAEPQPVDFVVFTPLRYTRLETNLEITQDVRFMGAASGGVLTVNAVAFGTILPGATLLGVNVPAGTTVVAQISGVPGGIGTYSLSNTTFTASPGTLATGALTLIQGAEAVVQMDFHSAGVDTTAGDMAQIVSTTLRDEFGVDYFAGLAAPLNGVVPFYADDPKQVPFINSENQYEWRWMLEGHFQVNQAVSVSQAYADSALLALISVRVKTSIPVLIDEKTGDILVSEDGTVLTPG